MDSAKPSLLALSRAASEQAKCIFYWRFVARWGVLAAGCGALFVPAAWEKTGFVFGVLALAAEVVVWILNRYGLARHELGEAARRHAMLADAFGGAPEPTEERDLRAKFDKKDEDRAAPLEDPDYYASTSQPGLGRLRDHLEESSFWSKDLFRKAASRTWKVLAALLAGVVLAVLVALPTTEGNTSLLIARVVVILLGFFVAMDVLGRALSWSSAARETEMVYRRLQSSGNTRTNKVLLATFGDYFVSTASSPPIPTDLHAKSHKRLNELWEKRGGAQVQ